MNSEYFSICFKSSGFSFFPTLKTRGFEIGKAASVKAVPVATPVINFGPKLSLIRRPKIEFLPTIFTFWISYW